jgi:hypothetical protein
MSEQSRDGGPAFARPGFTVEQAESQEGMSLRDWFAGQALQGILASLKPDLIQVSVAATSAYAFADAMLTSRAK